jgi:hypothetical protein
VYLNLVEGLLWVQDVVRSNRTTPTNTARALRGAVMRSNSARYLGSGPGPCPFRRPRQGHSDVAKRFAGARVALTLRSVAAGSPVPRVRYPHRVAARARRQHPMNRAARRALAAVLAQR